MCQLNDHYEHVGFNNGREVIIAEVIVGSASELPSITFFDGFELHERSRAWDVSTGDTYGLISDGTWVKQNDNYIIW
jgi:hypothetical protein